MIASIIISVNRWRWQHASLQGTVHYKFGSFTLDIFAFEQIQIEFQASHNTK